jgi:hypothetical protein
VNQGRFGREERKAMFEEAFLESAIAKYKAQKDFAERAIVQLGDEKLHQPLDENTVSMGTTEHVGNANGIVVERRPMKTVGPHTPMTRVVNDDQSRTLGAYCGSTPTLPKTRLRDRGWVLPPLPA